MAKPRRTSIFRSERLLASIFAWALGLDGWAAAPLVAIDAGHTVEAPGASAAGDGRKELLFNIDMALAIESALTKKGIASKQGNVPPRERESFAERASEGSGADFFLSVHHDSAPARFLAEVPDAVSPAEPGGLVRYEDRLGRFKGFSLFVDPLDRKGIACAKSVGASLIAAGESPSRYHAERAFGGTKVAIDAGKGVFAFPNLAVARLRKAPMALLEVGVIVNPAESARLRDPAVRRRVADAVASGLGSCLSAAGKSGMRE
jgi:N-acetylmuramoyl-L-alanine amidase